MIRTMLDFRQVSVLRCNASLQGHRMGCSSILTCGILYSTVDIGLGQRKMNTYCHIYQPQSNNCKITDISTGTSWQLCNVTDIVLQICHIIITFQCMLNCLICFDSCFRLNWMHVNCGSKWEYINVLLHKRVTLLEEITSKCYESSQHKSA